VPRLRLLFPLLLILLAAACQPTPAAETPTDPLALVTRAAELIRQTQTFRMIVEQTGAPYVIATDLGSVTFRRADAQYVAPNVMQADVRLLVIGGIPAEVGIFSQGENQFYRNEILTANQWVNALFAPGFNPETLVSSEAGFQMALEGMLDLEYVDVVTLESGVSAQHLRGRALGDTVTALLAGLVDDLGEEVDVEIYLDAATGYPARFVIVQPGSETADNPEPTTWTVDIFDINEPAEIEPPPGVIVPTPEAGA
jgi:hypothetical protein